MNILVVCHYGLYREFSSSFVHAQTTAYAALGHQVRVIVPIAIGKQDWNGSRSSIPLQQREKNGVQLYLLRYLSLSKYGEKWFNTANAIRAVRKRLDTLLNDFVPDVIHAHTLGFDSEIGAWLRDRLGIPLVVTTHGGDSFIPIKEGKLIQLRERANRADHLVCVSSLLKRQLEDCGATISTSVILNGFHVKDVSLRADSPPHSIVQVGYLITRKKADVTIQAAAHLRKRYPDVTLDIIGSGDEQARFQILCHELNMTDAVHFHGFLPNNKTLQKMSMSRFFIMPSVQEGFGIVYLEAMACGCVTIGTEGEGIADLIISGKNGFLVPPDNPDAIVRAVEWCLEHPAEADAIAEQGRQDALNLTWEKNAKQYIALFQQLAFNCN